MKKGEKHTIHCDDCANTDPTQKLTGWERTHVATITVEQDIDTGPMPAFCPFCGSDAVTVNP